MSKFIGRRINFGIGKESIRGTAVSPTFWIPSTSIEFDDLYLMEPVGLKYDNLSGFGEEIHITDKSARGSIFTKMDADMFGIFLLGIFGSSSPVGPADSAYTHTFSLAASNAHTSFTLVENNPISSFQYTLAMIERLEIRIDPEDIVSITVSFVARSSSEISDPGATYTARKIFNAKHLRFKIADLTGDLGSAKNIKLKNLRLIFDKNLIEFPIYNTLTTEEIYNQMFQISGSFVIDYEDRAYHNYLLQADSKAVRIQLVSKELIGVASVPQFTIDLSKVMFDSWQPNKHSDRVVEQSITFKALYDETNENIVNDCELINETSSY